MNKKIKNLKSTNSKEYWSILSNQDKDKTVNKVKLQTFFEHFKKLNELPNYNNEQENKLFKDN